MAMPPPAALLPSTPPAASPPDADGRPIISADLEGLTNGISALNSVRRPRPTYGSWAGAVAPPLQVIGGPGRLSDALDTALQVLSRADPIQPLIRHAPALLKLGVTDFASLSELTIFDLQEADIP